MRVAIVEDQLSQSALLADYLERWSGESGEPVEYQIYSSGEGFLNQLRQGFDVVFMDIELPGMDGVSVTRRIREADTEMIIVFVTQMAQLAVKGYEVNALDFLVKPLQYPMFVFKMKRILSACQQKQTQMLTIPITGGFKRVSVSGIRYVEVSGHTLIYHMQEGNIETRGKMFEVEKALSSQGFLRCNQCYLVNPRAIQEIQGKVITIGTDRLQISHPRYKGFMSELNQWLSKGG